MGNVREKLFYQENNYLLWKFIRKWKLIAEINTKFKIAKME
jgi:hypothetical protein